MDYIDVGRYWDRNAQRWIAAERAGQDPCRDLISEPAFLTMLPDVRGQSCLDLGCGDGQSSRPLAERGARVVGVDVAELLLREAVRQSGRHSVPRYCRGDAVRLPFRDGCFDFVTAFMSLMDMPDLDLVLSEVARILVPGGFLQFCIKHPYLTTPSHAWLQDAQGRTAVLAMSDYFDQSSFVETVRFRWNHAVADAPSFEIPRFPRPVSAWLNELVSVGLNVELVAEPSATPEMVSVHPALAAAASVPFFLEMRCRKGPARAGVARS
jgi:SAM-dependent methyltransferase